MADFLDAVGSALSNRLSNRSDEILNVLNNPAQYLQDRVENATTATQYGAGAGRGFVNPPVVNTANEVPKIAPLPSPTVMPERNVAPAGPVAPQDYASYIGKNESDNNPNIGYHNPKLGTAYGTFGITAPAYKDIQKSDPYFADRDITSLDAEEQKRALNVVTQNNARALQHYGVEATPGNLAGAHFLGAKGLSDYLKDGTISKAAADANGGEEKVRQIVNQRLKFGAAPSSGAVQPQAAPQAAPVTAPAIPGAPQAAAPTPAEAPQEGLAGPMYNKEYEQLTQGDPINLMALTKHDNPAIAMSAKAQLYDTFKHDKTQREVQATVDQDLSQGKIPNMNKKGEEGSYIKAYLFARLGLTDLAQQEQEKISPTRQTMPIMLGNQHYAATYNKNGDLLYAYDEAGKQVDDATKAKLAANAYGSKGLETGQTMMKDPEGNVWSHSTQKGTNQILWTNQSTGQTQTTAPAGLTPFGQINPVTRSNISLATSAERMMLARNDKDKAAGLTPTYSQDAIDSEKSRILNGGKPTVSIPQPTETPAPTKAGVPTAAPTAQAAPTAAVAPQGQGEIERRGTPALEAQAQAIFNGDQAMPTGMGANNARNQWLSARVNEIAQQQNKPFDPTLFKNRQEVESAFTKGKQSDVVRSMNVAIDHLDTMSEAAKALKNGQIPLFNDIANKFAKNTGQPAPTNFDAVKTLVGSEVAKAVAGGATALGDREEIRAEISNARSPEQLAGVIDKYQRLLAGQMNGLKTQYESGGGRRWDEKINPRTKEVLGRMEGEGRPTTVPAPYNDADKERRYQEYLKKRNAGK